MGKALQEDVYCCGLLLLVLMLLSLEDSGGDDMITRIAKRKTAGFCHRNQHLLPMLFVVVLDIIFVLH